MPAISVIIPVLNEEKQLPAQLEALKLQQSIDEVIVVDGGSCDNTRALVVQHGASLIESPPGRAQQMNAGARQARGDVLLFLHVDTRLPAGAAPLIASALGADDVVAGAFRTWTIADDGRSAPWLHLADLRSRYSSLPYGDQALFVRRTVFEAIGGYRHLELMEDYELSRALRAKGRIRVLPQSVQVSGRRFLRHPFRYGLFVNVFPLLYRLGVSARTLRRHYQDIR